DSLCPSRRVEGAGGGRGELDIVERDAGAAVASAQLEARGPGAAARDLEAAEVEAERGGGVARWLAGGAIGGKLEATGGASGAIDGDAHAVGVGVHIVTVGTGGVGRRLLEDGAGEQAP